MTFGGIIVLAITAAVVAIGAKVKKNSQKLQELEDLMSKE